MVAKNSTDWPPPGWKIQVRVKNGRKIKSYINKNLGHKLYSKSAVVRCIKTGSICGEGRQPMNGHIKKSSGEKNSQKTNKFPEWLPDGWTMELKTQKSGSRKGTKYKCYIDPSTGSKFYSMPEVSRYLETIQHSACSSGEKKEAISVQASSNVVIESSVDEGLPRGWIKEIRTKKTGDKTRRDLFYINSETGYVFRSRKDVDRYLETGVVSRHAYKRKNCWINEELTACRVTSPSSAKRKKTGQSAEERQLFSGGENVLESTPRIHNVGGVCVGADSVSVSHPDIVQEKPSMDFQAAVSGLKTVDFVMHRDSDGNGDKAVCRETQLLSTPLKNIFLEKKAEDLQEEQSIGQPAGSSFVSIPLPDKVQEICPRESTTREVTRNEASNISGLSLLNSEDADANGSRVGVMKSEPASAPAKDLLLVKPQDAKGGLYEGPSAASLLSVPTPSVLQEKYLIESLVENGTQTEESNLSRQALSEARSAHQSEKEAVKRYSEHASSPAGDILIRKPSDYGTQKCSANGAQASKNGSKNRRQSRKVQSMPCRSSKRLAGIEAAPVPTPFLHQVQYLVKSAVEKGAQISNPNRLPLSKVRSADYSENRAVEWDSGPDPCPSKYVLPGNPLDYATEKCCTNEAQVSKSRSKDRKKSKKEHIMPCRFSKRLAGIEAEPLPTPYVHQVYLVESAVKKGAQTERLPLPEAQSADQSESKALKGDSELDSSPSKSILLEKPVDGVTEKCNSNGAQVSKSRSKNRKESRKVHMFPCRSSKRLAGIEAEPIPTPYVDQVLYLMESAVEKGAQAEESNLSRLPLPEAQSADQRESKALKWNSELDSSHSKSILLEKPVDWVTKKCNTNGAQVSKSRSENMKKSRKVHILPCRSSKRLAGIEAEPVVNSVAIELADRGTHTPSGKTAIMPILGPGPESILENSGVVPHESTLGNSQHLDVGAQGELVPVAGLLPFERADSVIDKTSGKTVVVPTLVSVSHESTLENWGSVPYESTLENSQELDVNTQGEIAPLASCYSEDPINEELLNKIEELFESPKDENYEKPILMIDTPFEGQPFAEQQLASGEANGECPLEERRSASLEVNSVNFVAEQHSAILEVNRNGPIAEQHQSSASLEVNGEHPVVEKRLANVEVSGNYHVAEQQSASLEANRNHLVAEKVSASLEPSGNQPVSEQQSASIEVYGNQPIEQQLLTNLETNGRDSEQPESQFILPALFSDPCLEFAFKTLTGAIPLEDNHLAIQDYVQHQLRTSTQSNSSFSLFDIGSPDFNPSDTLDMSDRHKLQTKPASSLPDQILPDINEDRPPGF